MSQYRHCATALELEELDVLGVELDDSVEELEEAVLEALDFVALRVLDLRVEELRLLRPDLRLSDLSSSFVLVFLAALLLAALVALFSFWTCCLSTESSPKPRIGSSSELVDWGEGEREGEARRLFLPSVDFSTRGFLRPCLDLVWPVRSIMSSSSAPLFLRRSVDNV